MGRVNIDKDSFKQVVKDAAKSAGYDVDDYDDIYLEPSDDILDEMCLRFYDILQEEANSCSLPASVRRNVDDIRVKFRRESGYIKFEINFNNQTRLSLYKAKTGTYTGEGVRNIVNLFNTGYDDYVLPVRGRWIGHTTKSIRSLTYRERLGFIDEALSRFSEEYEDYFSSVDSECYEED